MPVFTLSTSSAYGLIIFLCFAAFGCGSHSHQDPRRFLFDHHQEPASTYSYLVAFKGKRELSNHEHHRQVDSHLKPLDFLTDESFHRDKVFALSSFSMTHFSEHPPVEPRMSPHILHGPVARSWSEALISRVTFSSHAKAQRVLSYLQEQGKIWYAEPDRTSSLAVEKLSPQFQKASKLLYHIDMIQLGPALEYLESLPPDSVNRPLVAVMDSGVDVEHPALKNRVVDLHKQSWPQARACPGDRYGCNTTVGSSKKRLGDGSVYPIGTTGFGQSCSQKNLSRQNDLSRTPMEMTKYCRHGTLVSGLVSGFSSLVYGACPYCDIVPIKIVDKNYIISDSSIIRALEYISLVVLKDGRRINVVNVSLGKTSKSISVASLIRRLSEQQNIVFVGAAGNDNTMLREYPGSLKDVMAVSAVNSTKEKILQSNYGGWISLSAPGHYVLSSIPGGGVFYDHGTSMATPLVAGVAGLVFSLSGGRLSASEVRGILEKTADSQGLYDSNQNYQLQQTVKKTEVPLGSLGWGVVDASAAVRHVQNPDSSITSSNGCGSLGRPPHSQNLPPPWHFLILILAPILMTRLSSHKASKISGL